MSEIEEVRELHKRLLTAAMNSIRRKMIKEIRKGITREDLRKTLKDLSDFEFRFNLEFLIAKGFVIEKEGKLHLTEEGEHLMYEDLSV